MSRSSKFNIPITIVNGPFFLLNGSMVNSDGHGHFLFFTNKIKISMGHSSKFNIPITIVNGPIFLLNGTMVPHHPNH